MTDQLELWPEEATNERLSWSVSRDRRYRDCLRKYYLHHYGSRGGGQPNAEPRTRQAYVLKHLRNRFMWVGMVVHEMIELALGAFKRGERVHVDALVERGTRRMRAQYAESIQGVFWDRPELACGLAEHEYREPVPREEWQAQRDRMERCLRAFFALPLAATIQALPPWRYLAVEALGSFDFDGATIMVKPDFAWRDADGHIHIVDWKTGQVRHDEERLQIATYALFAQRSWGAVRGGITAVLVHLDNADGQAQVDEYPIAPEHLAAAEAAIRASVSGMRALVAGVGPGGAPSIDQFPMTSDLRRCATCCFRRLCQR